MASCDYCGKQLELTHICKECDGHFCSKHKSKAAHDCESIDDSRQEHKTSLGASRRKTTFSNHHIDLGHEEHDESRHDDYREERRYRDEPRYREEPVQTSYKWKKDKPDWQYTGPGGANLKVIGRFAILAFLVILMTGAGPFHNDAIGNAGHEFWNGLMNMTHSLPDNNSLNITVNVVNNSVALNGSVPLNTNASIPVNASI